MKAKITAATIEKAMNLSHLNAEYYFNVLRLHMAGEWFSPTNKENEAFTICRQIHEANLICMKREPNGKTVKVSFLYNI